MTDYRGTLQLKRGREKPVENRHPWIFSGAVEAVHGDPEPGDLVAVVDSRDRWLATAYYNARSQIRARILSWEADDVIDEAWWYARLRAAIEQRLALQFEPDTTAYRLVNAEADFLPGLVVDRYADYLVLQALTMGIERRKAMLASALSELTGAAGIVERSDVDVREKESLPTTRGLLAGEQPPPSVEIREHGLRFLVNLMEGHKTGLYLDQR